MSPPPNAVVVDGQQVFTIPAPLGKFLAEDRAKSTSLKISKIKNQPKFDPQTISTSDTAGSTEIMAGDIILASVTDADGKAVGLTRQALAQQDSDKLTAALVTHNAQQAVQGALQAASPQNIQESLIYLLFQPLTVRILLFVLGFLVLSIISGFLRRWVNYYVAGSEKRFAMNKLITIGAYVVAALFASIVFQETLGNLAVVLGAAAAGIAFALQSLIVSLAGWVGITFGDYLKIGDRVEIAGIKGDVIDIGFIRTRLMEIGQWVNGDLYTGRVVQIANSFVFNNPVYNYSGHFNFLWDEIIVSLKVNADAALARSVLEKVTAEIVTPYTNQASADWTRFSEKYLVGRTDIKPAITMAVTDKMEFTIRYVVDYRDRRKVKDLLYSRVLEEFAKSGDKLVLASA